MKAFAYLTAGEGETDQFMGQVTILRAYAEARNISISNTFRDVITGGTKDLENRPAFLEMMTALHSNGTRLVLIEKLDSLAPDLMLQETIIADLRRNGFEVISGAEPDLLQDDPTRKLMRQLFAVIANYEKTMIALKLRGGRLRQRRKTGRSEGAKQYGEMPGESEVIDRMKAFRAKGIGFDRIAELLNAEGIRPRRGNRWYGSAVNKILTRESLAGPDFAVGLPT